MPRKNVLVVEDDDTTRRLLTEYLKEHSALSVDAARDGVEALHRVVETSYGCIVLDLMMPHMSGIDFLDSLAALVFDPSVKILDIAPPVIVITSASPDTIGSDEIEERFPSMVHAVLRKPLEITALACHVERLCR